MKLSAPSLPFDFKPTLSNSGGRQAARGTSGDSGSRSNAKFGEILIEKAVRSHHAERRVRPTPASRATPEIEPNDSASTEEESSESSNGDQLTSPETLASAVPVLVPGATTPSLSPPVSVEPAANANETESDVSITSTDVGADAGTETPAGPTVGNNDEVRFPGRAPHGRPFSGNMAVGKSQALYRAFGLNAQRVAAAKLVDVPQVPDDPQVPIVLPPPPAETENSELTDLSANTTVVPPDSSVIEPPVVEPAEGELPVVVPTVAAEVPAGALAEENSEPGITVVPETSPGSGEVIAEDISETNDSTVSAVPTETSAGPTVAAPDMTFPDTAVTDVPEVPAEALEIGQQVVDIAPVVVSETAVEAALADVLPTTLQAAVQGAENFADIESGPLNDVKITEKQPLITSLTAEAKGVARSYGRIGINAAKTETLMADAASLSTPPPAATSESPLGLAPVAFDAKISAQSDQGTADVDPAARRAVESALAVAEQFTPGEQRSVRLHFNVGGEDLAVRVELRGEQVHTTFRTDSPELRSALAREWQAVSSTTAAERGQRLADPVFASAGNSLSADSGAAQQRHPETRDAHVAAHEANQMRRALRNSEIDPVISEVAPSIRPPQFNSSRLHTFA